MTAAATAAGPNKLAPRSGTVAVTSSASFSYSASSLMKSRISGRSRSVAGVSRSENDESFMAAADISMRPLPVGPWASYCSPGFGFGFGAGAGAGAADGGAGGAGGAG